jgi:glycerol uptake facilitator-like aquaporin
MSAAGLSRKIAAEAIGAGLLVAAVVGSGIMAAKLSGANMGVALLGNTIPTGAILVVLITILGPVSGAHFNPVVSLVLALRNTLAWQHFAFYVPAQIVGGCLGAVLANLMFDLPAIQSSTTLRGGPGQWLAEAVATFGLVGVILGGLRFAVAAVPWLVGLFITSAYWFTASTSFANPAVTLARTLSDSFAGIAPGSVMLFIVAQLVGGLLGLAFWGWLFAVSEKSAP